MKKYGVGDWVGKASRFTTSRSANSLRKRWVKLEEGLIFILVEQVNTKTCLEMVVIFMDILLLSGKMEQLVVILFGTESHRQFVINFEDNKLLLSSKQIRKIKWLL